MEVVDLNVNEGGCNNVFLDCASKGLITLETSRVQRSMDWLLAGPRKAVYKVVFQPYSEEQRSATGVSGMIVSAEYVRSISHLQYQRMCQQTGFGAELDELDE